MKTATFLIKCRLLSFYNLRFKLREENLTLETVNENNYNEETKMSRKTETSFYLEVSPRTTSSPSLIVHNHQRYSVNYTNLTNSSSPYVREPE